MGQERPFEQKEQQTQGITVGEDVQAENLLGERNHNRMIWGSSSNLRKEA